MSELDNVTVIPADYPCSICDAPSAVYNLDDKCPKCQKLMDADIMASSAWNGQNKVGCIQFAKSGGSMKKSYLGSHD